MSTNIVELRGVSLGLANQVGPEIAKDLCLTLRPKRIVGLIGPNGCGKTSLMRFLVYAAPHEYVSGGHVSRPAITDLGYVPQGASATASLMPWLSAVDNVASVFRFAGFSWDTSRRFAVDRVGHLLRLVPGGCSCERFSGGEAGVVVTARELARPHLKAIFLDEPTAALDYERRIEVMRCVRDMCITEDVAAMIVAHDPELAALFCDEVLVLSRRPMTVVSRIEIVSDSERGMPGLGTSWLSQATKEIEHSLKAVLMKQ